MLRPEPRASLVLGDDALDLGYITGFGASELAGDRPMRWLHGRGTIVLPLPRQLEAGSEVTLDLAAPLPIDGPLEVTIDGRWRVRIAVAPVWRRYHLMLPPALAGAKQLRLDLRAPITVPMRVDPRSDDARPLSVTVHRVAVEW